MSTVESIARPRRNGERRRAPTASISKESPAITGVVEMVIRRPILPARKPRWERSCGIRRSEERFSRNAETDLVCRLLLEKKKKIEEQHIQNRTANDNRRRQRERHHSVVAR